MSDEVPDRAPTASSDELAASAGRPGGVEGASRYAGLAGREPSAMLVQDLTMRPREGGPAASESERPKGRETRANSGRLPDFVIAGTNWLEHHLARHPRIFTPRRQIHFFDRHYDRGHAWYASWFRGAEPGQICGEKTTEYFDTPTAENFARRVADAYPDLKVIVVLREPVGRALSALQHMVNAGLERLRPNLDRLLFDDMARAPDRSFRYVERGFYARQLDALTTHIPPERLLLLIFEEDIVASPRQSLERVFRFLGVDPVVHRDIDRPVNKVRLSTAGAALAYRFHDVPYARGVIRRIDRLLGLPEWKPRFSPETVERLREIFREPNEELFERLGRRIPSWTRPAAHWA